MPELRPLACALAVALLGGCQRKTALDDRPALSASRAPALAPVATATTTPTAREHTQQPAVVLVMAWNAALDNHAADKLEALYAPRVLFYGASKPREEVVRAKRAALDAAPDDKQRIDKLALSKTPNGFIANFEKHSGPQMAAVAAARLGLESVAGKLAIAEESDATTDAHFELATPSKCYGALSEIVGAHPVIAKDVQRVARSQPLANPGGILYGEDARGLEAAQGYFLPDHFDARWWVDVIAGNVSIRDAYSLELLSLSEEQRESVQRACTQPNRSP